MLLSRHVSGNLNSDKSLNVGLFIKSHKYSVTLIKEVIPHTSRAQYLGIKLYQRLTRKQHIIIKSVKKGVTF